MLAKPWFAESILDVVNTLEQGRAHALPPGLCGQKVRPVTLASGQGGDLRAAAAGAAKGLGRRSHPSGPGSEILETVSGHNADHGIARSD